MLIPASSPRARVPISPGAFCAADASSAGNSDTSPPGLAFVPGVLPAPRGLFVTSPPPFWARGHRQGREAPLPPRGQCDPTSPLVFGNQAHATSHSTYSGTAKEGAWGGRRGHASFFAAAWNFKMSKHGTRPDACAGGCSGWGPSDPILPDAVREGPCRL